MGYIFDFNDSKSYEAWCTLPSTLYAFDVEMGMAIDMLSPMPGERLIDIGCGAGRSLEPLLGYELQLTGIDPSPYMLDIAREKLHHKADLHRGFAEDLPFDDNSFEYALLIISLEFTEMPAKAIEEACRVAKDKVFICVMNKYAPQNIMRRIKGLFVKNTLNHARFFSIWELKQIIFAILGDVPVSWRTTLQFPCKRDKYTRFVENLKLIQKSPFGTMIGMAITPIPKFNTRPLSLKIKKQSAYNPVRGFAMDHHPSSKHHRDKEQMPA